jgi:hypothetical protein
MRVAHLAPAEAGLTMIWVLPVMAVPSNLPHLAGALSPRLLNADMTYPVILPDKYRQA